MTVQRSGLFEAGRILLLVGAILAAVSAGLLLLFALGLGLVSAAFNESPATDALGATIIGVVYGSLAIISAAGAVLGFLAYGKANAGDAHGAWIRGLVASLLPPVQPILLIGAILCKVSPECRAQETGTWPPA